MNPPQVTLGVAEPADRLAEGQIGKPGDLPSPGPDGTSHRLRGVAGVDPEMRRGWGPASLTVEHQDHEPVEINLDVPDGAVVVEDSGSGSLAGPKRLGQEPDLSVGVVGDDPRDNPGVAGGNLAGTVDAHHLILVLATDIPSWGADRRLARAPDSRSRKPTPL